jgi:hypothetical protein
MKPSSPLTIIVQTPVAGRKSTTGQGQKNDDRDITGHSRYPNNPEYQRSRPADHERSFGKLTLIKFTILYTTVKNTRGFIEAIVSA